MAKNAQAGFAESRGLAFTPKTVRKRFLKIKVEPKRLGIYIHTMKTNWTNEEIKNEIEMLKKQTPATNLPPHLWEAAAKNSLKQKSFGFSVVDVTPKGFGPNE